MVDLARLRDAKQSGRAIARSATPDGSAFTLRPAYPADPGLRVHDVHAFTELRSLHADSFFDTARPQEEAVRRWVKERYDPDDSQINFVVENEGGAVLLFLGLSEIEAEAGRAEFGRLMRAQGAPRGCAASALPLLFGWAKEIGLRTIALEVFADNAPAKKLYERAGFRIDHEFRRAPVEQDGRIIWNRSTSEGGRAVLAMTLDLTGQTRKAEA